MHRRAHANCHASGCCACALEKESAPDYIFKTIIDCLFKRTGHCTVNCVTEKEKDGKDEGWPSHPLKGGLPSHPILVNVMIIDTTKLPLLQFLKLIKIYYYWTCMQNEGSCGVLGCGGSPKLLLCGC